MIEANQFIVSACIASGISAYFSLGIGAVNGFSTMGGAVANGAVNGFFTTDGVTNLLHKGERTKREVREKCDHNPTPTARILGWKK